MPETSQPESYTLRVEWPKDQPQALLANQFAISLGVPTRSGPDAVYLMVGHADPPLLVGRPDGAEQLAGLDALPIDVLGRYVFTRSRLEELIQLLQRAAQIYDEASGGESGADATDEP